jgi:hypothetical protein
MGVFPAIPAIFQTSGIDFIIYTDLLGLHAICLSQKLQSRKTMAFLRAHLETTTFSLIIEMLDSLRDELHI